MELTDTEKKDILLKAGAEIISNEDWTYVPCLESAGDFANFVKLPEEEKNKYYQPVPPEDVRVCGFKPEDLVSFILDDNSMYPDYFQGDELYIAYREPLQDGRDFAVMVNDKILIRRINIQGEMIELVPVNMEYSRETYRKDDIRWLGRVCGHSREL